MAARESTVARRVRRANGSRIDGRNRLTASAMCGEQDREGQSASCAIVGGGAARAGRSRPASRATHSPSAARSRRRRGRPPRTPRGHRPRGRRRSRRERGSRRVAARRAAAGASGMSTPAMRFASTTSKGLPSPARGRLPSRARIRRTSRFRRALASVASTAIGIGVDAERARRAELRTAAIDRIPEPQPTSRTRAPARRRDRRAPRARRGTAASSGGGPSRTPCPGRARGRRRPVLVDGGDARSAG